ncbi:hypothetical protein Pint_21519 [Pistacia integerrima]|uniref:Uncharacterized protein n=1 Tax=Pistacia integerrima TaxID=434235 RepID=A0ACC0XBW2_9ROSI|nr:hypothetical protein Pint_21519 [Pistacia integerrima]
MMLDIKHETKFQHALSDVQFVCRSPGLEKVWDVKPSVNGKEIMNVLQLKSGRPLVREWQQKLLAWQLAHPSGTAEDCLDWMKQTYSKRVKLEPSNSVDRSKAIVSY